MAKARTLEAKLAELKKLRGAAASMEVVAALQKALADPSNFLAAEAAEQVAAAGLRDLMPDLAAAFTRFLEDGETTDKQCRAKIAIVETLNKLEYDDADLFWIGARYRQPEPVWGGSQDTAAPVRVGSSFALVRLRDRGVLAHLADLLCDPEKPARLGAAEALVYSNTEAAALLLRLKCRAGDKEPEVIAECLGGLLSLQGKAAVPLVAEFVNAADPNIQEYALLALGESRLPEAFAVLRDFFPKARLGDLREVVLTAIGLMRLSEGIDFLLEVVAKEDRAAAKAALTALAIHRHDERMHARAATAVEKNGTAQVKAHFEQAFNPG